MSWDAQPPSEPPQPVQPAGYDQYGQPIAPQRPRHRSPQGFPQQQDFRQQQGASQWHAPQPDAAQWNGPRQWEATPTDELLPAAPLNTGPSNAGPSNTAARNPAPWAEPQYEAEPPVFGGPPPKRSRTGLYVGAGAGAVLIAGIIAAVASMSGGGNNAPVAQGGSPSATASAGASAPNNVTNTSPTHSGTPRSQSSHVLSVPSGAGPLHLVVNADTAQRITDLKKNLASNTAYPDPQVGFYRSGYTGPFTVWLLAQDTTGITDFQNSLGLLGPAGVMKQITDGASMTDVTVQKPGTLGGALDCGKLSVDNNSQVNACVWVDHTTFGWVYALPSVSQKNLIQYTQELRAAAEH